MNSCVAVIPARRAEKTIGRTLESLRLGNAAFVSRVLVVTSACDATAAVVRAWSARDARVELVLAGAPSSAGAARNLGRSLAPAGGLLLFMDADCALERDGAARLAAELARRDAAAIGARILGEAGVVARVRHILEFKEAASLRAPPAEWLPPSTTLLCRANAFDRAGGFPDLWPGEDLVFARRLRDLGAAVVRSAEVRSVHRHPCGIAEMLRHQLRLGRTAAVARRMASMHGERFARSRALALLLLPGRTLRIARWQAGEGGRAVLAALALAPLLVAGLAAWTAGFVSASGSGRAPATRDARSSSNGANRARAATGTPVEWRSARTESSA